MIRVRGKATASRFSLNWWNLRQVLDCGDGVCAVAALGLKPTRFGWIEAPGSAHAKAVNRSALPRTPKRWRALRTHSWSALFIKLAFLLLLNFVSLACSGEQAKINLVDGKSPSLGAAARIGQLERELQQRTEHSVQKLDLDLIMLGPDFAGTPPAAVRWAGDNSRLWFQWKQPGEKEPAVYEVVRGGGHPRRLSKEEEAGVPSATANYDQSGRWAVYSYEGDIHLLDTHTREYRKLTQTAETESAPRFTRDGQKVTFRRGDNLFLLPLFEHPMLIQLTDLRSGKDPDIEKEKKGKEGSRKFLKEQQTELFLELGKKEEKQREEEERRKARRPKPYFFEDKKVNSLQLSADEKFVAVEFSLESKERQVAQVPNFLALSGYTEELKSRTKVGDKPEVHSLAVLDVAGVQTFDVEFPKPSFTEAAQPKEPGSPDSTTDAGKSKTPILSFSDAVWSERGHKLLALARAANNKDQWLLRIDVEARQSVPLDHQHDDAWVLDGVDCGFFSDDTEVWFTSEQTGYRHLYAVRWDGGKCQGLTSGKFEVWEVTLSKDRQRFFFRANLPGPEIMHFYQLPVAGGQPRQLTSELGRHQVKLSPDENWLADIYSTSNQPWELFVQPRENSQPRERLTDSSTPAFKSYPWIEPKLVGIPARDGATVPARLYVPTAPHPLRPAVIFVHGAGYLQNVHRWWSQYSREYMFHHFLMEHGYTVLDVDYRGSAGYGRDWRTAIYRHMGGQDLTDQIDAVDYLVKQHGADPERIGIYGGSYGGFITLMALFTAPKSFGAGAALRPVTDWAHYNHGYTANILNQPQEDEEAFRRSSPIYFAEGLEDPLLICHGLVDVNVHVQDTLRLAQRLIELRKPNFEVALYPVEDHAFQSASSWADEYNRIFKLFEQHLKKKP